MQNFTKIDNFYHSYSKHSSHYCLNKFDSKLDGFQKSLKKLLTTIFNHYMIINAKVIKGTNNIFSSDNRSFFSKT